MICMYVYIYIHIMASLPEGSIYRPLKDSGSKNDTWYSFLEPEALNGQYMDRGPFGKYGPLLVGPTNGGEYFRSR